MPSCGSLATWRSDSRSLRPCRSSQKRIVQSFNPRRQGAPAVGTAAQPPRVPLELVERVGH
uniref:Uncharacterized protein n=1 Tax=Oryza meridionalis TaxID=40149 RepID=A0A0E0EE10_9ORYZ